MSVGLTLVAALTVTMVAGKTWTDIPSPPSRPFPPRKDNSSHSSAPRRSPDEEIMTVNIDLLEVNLAGCNTKGVSYTGTDDLLLNTFSTAGARQCWMYCRYAIKCLAMSFQVMDGTCSLLAEYREDESMYGAEDVHVAVSKNCMESDNKNSAGANLTEIVSLSSSGTGFLIQQVSSALVCLAAGKRMLKTEDKEMYRVTWKSCAESTTTRWIMRPVGHLESEDKASSELYQISPADQLDLCLDVHISEKGQGAMEAVLKKCREERVRQKK